MSRNSRLVHGVKTKMKIDTKDLTGGVKEEEDIPISVPKMGEKVVIGNVKKSNKKKSSKKKEVT